MNNLTRYPLLFLLVLPCLLFSQTKDFSKVDEFARNVPNSKTTSISKLANYLTADFADEEQKVRSIYVWIADNIRYNYKVIRKENISVEDRIKKEQATKVLKTKLAVCEGYSNLFKALCDESGVTCEIVTGKSKDSRGRIPRIGHAWNAVRVNGQWYPVDVTWGAGGISSEKQKYVKNFREEFFLGEPAFFIQHHYPKDPVFQFLDLPITLKEFSSNKTIAIEKNTDEPAVFENITDTLNHYASLDEKGKMLNSCQRILRFDPDNDYANYKVAKIHYDEAIDNWEAYQHESKEVIEKKSPLTWEKIEKWEGQIEVFKKGLEMTKKHLNKIPSGSKYASTKRRILSSIERNNSIHKMLDKQFADYKNFLTQTGAPKN
ncbi:MAG: transglutaminase domain-containing protein [Bacteroidota bacterium]